MLRRLKRAFFGLACASVFVAALVFNSNLSNSERRITELPLPPIHSSQIWTGKELDCLANVVYNEARNQSIEGQKAVAAVVINRSLDSRWPNDLCKVVKQPHQFASWVPKPKNGIDRNALVLARQVAFDVTNDYSCVPSCAMHAVFFNSGPPHKWGHRQGSIGAHTFYS
jgi:hypothetical protein